jgi:hypothetical protein
MSRPVVGGSAVSWIAVSRPVVGGSAVSQIVRRTAVNEAVWGDALARASGTGAQL